MTVVSWEVPFSLITPQGTLALNSQIAFSAGNGMYILNPQGCSTSIELRLTDDFIPEQDGEQPHPRYWGGYVMNLGLLLMENANMPACDELLQEMSDNLMKHIRAYTRPPAPPNDARVYWTPNGEAQRMLKDAVINDGYQTQLIDGGATQTVFQVKSPYPYALTQAETTTALDATLTNGGTADMWPVIKVYGATSSFTITNSSVTDESGNALQIIYDGTAIGGGDYVEIDCFNGTVFENGDGANLSGSIDFLSTDYFWLQPGDNDITIVGATADVLWADAWG